MTDRRAPDDDLLEGMVGRQARLDAYAEVEDLAEWSPWLDFTEGLATAPRLPGVYLLREPATLRIRYVGMAGERRGSGRPMGLYGRLQVYRTGKGAVSGFGETALDRALGDPVWVAAKLEHLQSVGPERAKDWARDAIQRLAPEVSWATRLDSTNPMRDIWRFRSRPYYVPMVSGTGDGSSPLAALTEPSTTPPPPSSAYAHRIASST